jgi:2,4-dienoyl-CoA reductase-like NADH-dependent reductase (Old Yellow Enzyme family)
VGWHEKFGREPIGFDLVITSSVILSHLRIGTGTQLRNRFVEFPMADFMCKGKPPSARVGQSITQSH